MTENGLFHMSGGRSGFCRGSRTPATSGCTRAAVLQQCCCLRLRITASGWQALQSDTFPPPPSKMLQQKAAVRAGSCLRTFCRLCVKEKQPNCQPHFVAQLARCWSCDVHIRYLASNRNHIWCLEQGVKGVNWQTCSS